VNSRDYNVVSRHHKNSGEKMNEVLLIDDHPIMRMGLGQVLSKHGQLHVCGETHETECALKLAKNTQPDLIILNMHLRQQDGAALLQALRALLPRALILIFSECNACKDVQLALKFGANGYLLKTIDSQQLLSKIDSAFDGALVLSETLTQSMLTYVAEEQETSRFPELTNREKDVLEHIAQGCSNKNIARKLSIAESTVKVHVKRLLSKLNMNSRVEAAVWVVENNLF
jgi:two-component system, NarL family, nitrate/nitrite response regulator NarL